MKVESACGQMGPQLVWGHQPEAIPVWQNIPAAALQLGYLKQTFLVLDLFSGRKKPKPKPLSPACFCWGQPRKLEAAMNTCAALSKGCLGPDSYSF
jgi:hypothetical protein